MDTQIVPGLSNSLLEQLADELAIEQQQEGDVTVRMLTEKTGHSENKVRRILDKKVADGELIRVWGKHTAGYNGWLYRKPKEGDGALCPIP